MINIKSSGQMPTSAGCTLQRYTQPIPTSHYSSTLASLDAMLHTPAFGHEHAFHTRRQLAWCAHHQGGATDVFESDVPVPSTYKRTRRIDPGLKVASQLGFVCP